MKCKACQKELARKDTVCPVCGLPVDPIDRFVDTAEATFAELKSPGTFSVKKQAAVTHSTLNLKLAEQEEPDMPAAEEKEEGPSLEEIMARRKGHNKPLLLSICITAGLLVLSALIFGAYQLFFAPKISLTNISNDIYTSTQSILQKACDEEYLNTMAQNLEASLDTFSTAFDSYTAELQAVYDSATTSEELTFVGMATNLCYNKVLNLYYTSLLPSYTEEQQAEKEYLENYISSIDALTIQMLNVQTDEQLEEFTAAYNAFAAQLQAESEGAE